MMFTPYLAIIITIITGWLIIKRYPTHMVLLLSGLLLTAIAIITGHSNILPKGATSTGFIWFDMVDLLRLVNIKYVSNIGMIIMVAAGFAKYMEIIGASGALVHLCVAPLRKLHQPYIVMAFCYLLGQSMTPMIPSAGGAAMLLLTTLYPIMISVGVSRAAAAATIGCAGCIGMGPGTGTAVFAAGIAGVEPIIYFVKYQLPVAIPVMIIISLVNSKVQSHFDKKNDDIYGESLISSEKELPVGPAYYAVLPFLPIVLLCLFSQLGYSQIQLNTVTSLLISWLVSVMIELIRRRKPREVLQDAMAMFKNMGAVFSTIVALIITAEMFANGLKLSGLIDLIMQGAAAGGLGLTPMSILLCGLIALVTILTGSGVGALMSFGHLATEVATSLGGNVELLISCMQFSAGLFRGMSPVAGAIIIVAGAAGVNPLAIIRRTVVPLSAGWITMMIANYLLLG